MLPNFLMRHVTVKLKHAETASKGAFSKNCSENMQQIYRRTPMPSIKLLCNFIEIALWHGLSPVNLLHIFREPVFKNFSGGLLLNM